MDVPVIEQVRIQARVLVPLVKALQAEPGEEFAHRIIRKALGGLYRKLGEKWWRTLGGSHFGDKMASVFEQFAAGDGLDYEELTKSPEAFEVNLTGCRYAEFYEARGVQSRASC